MLVCGAQMAAAQTTDYDHILPTASMYGRMGLLDMPNARMMPDGYLGLNVAIKTPDDRVNLTFQAFPWLEASFRYSINYALAPIGQRALYDRSFDFKFRLWEEDVYTPQIALGLQDMIGTGVYSAEYLVATKRFGPLDLTAGMGWGRFASRGTFSNPLGLIDPAFYTRPGDTTNTGGYPLANDFFRGPDVGIFGGIEYLTPVPNLTLKVEYSTDDYAQEGKYHENPAVRHLNYAPVPVNVGVSYRLWNNLDLGAAWMYGRWPALTANIEMNPKEPNWPVRIDPLPPFVPRPPGAGRPIMQVQLGGDTTGGDIWPVHFIDLTALSAPDDRPPDPALYHDSEWRIADVFRRAGLRVTDGWMAGDTLVAQVDLAGPPGPPCASLTRNGVLPAREIVLVARDWNPIEICGASSSGDASPGAQPAAAPNPLWQPDTIGRMRRAIEDQQLVVEGITVSHGVVRVVIENDKYFRDTEAISRTLRALSASAPADIAAFEVTTSMSHVPLTTVTVSRTQIDAGAKGDATPAELWDSTIFSDASPDTDYSNGTSDPQFSWTLFPSLQTQLFDPNNPVYVGVGISASTHTEFLPGLVLDNTANYEIANNFGSITRPSNSLLPRVRTDVVEYLQHGSTGIDDLTLSQYLKPMPEVYARLTAGYIEQMFAGVGGEVLYRPFGQRWAIGADIYDVYQRQFDDLFGLQSYHVVTGHASLYVELPWEQLTTVVRAGRYLAGDYGATFELYRRFDTGIIIGAWVTFTNVPFSTFGEGSFDKGIKIVIPTEWALPFGTPTKFEEDLRPIQRDGGQPLYNDAELYDMTQSSSYGDLQRQWPSLF